MESSVAAWARQALDLSSHHSGPGGGQRWPKGTGRCERLRHVLFGFFFSALRRSPGPIERHARKRRCLAHGRTEKKRKKKKERNPRMEKDTSNTSEKFRKTCRGGVSHASIAQVRSFIGLERVRSNSLGEKRRQIDSGTRSGPSGR